MQQVTDSQIAFGRRLGLDLTNKSTGEAQAMIEDTVQLEFFGERDLGKPTVKQIELAAKFGRDISNVTRRVGNAVIDDLMTDLNLETITREKLVPGVTVINKHDPLQQKRVVSSITSDGTVYLRGGNGARAWARSLLRVKN